jgi:hypothetical protein
MGVYDVAFSQEFGRANCAIFFECSPSRLEINIEISLPTVLTWLLIFKHLDSTSQKRMVPVQITDLADPGNPGFPFNHGHIRQ